MGHADRLEVAYLSGLHKTDTELISIINPCLTMNVTMSMRDVLLPVNYINIFVRYLQQRGISVEQVLEGTSVTREMLDDPDTPMTLENYRDCILNGYRLTQDPSLGLKLGERLNITAHGMLGFAAMNSETLGKVLELLLRFFKTRLPLFEVSSFVEGDYLLIQFDETVALADIRIFIIEALFASFKTMYTFLLGLKDIPGLKVKMVIPKPDYVEEYERIFGPEVYFSQSRNLLMFPAKLLNENLPYADVLTARQATRHYEESVANLLNKDSLLVKVKQILLKRAGRFPNVEAIAEQLNMSPRTLRRQLQNLGTSYQDILNEVRKTLAVQYLETTSLTVDEIAHLLAYNDPSNFGRAFKKWTGQSPSHYRKQQE